MQKKVLIVEDEVLTSDLIRRYLIERGHLVTDQCLSYEEAVTSFHNEKPDVALIDIRLYGQKSGIDLASYLSSQPNCPTLIFLTAQYDQLTVEKALGTQPDGYLTKPIQKESLWTTIETAQRIQGHQHDDKPVHQHIISDGKHHHTVLEDEILFIKSDHVYIQIYLKDRSDIMVRMSLEEIYSDLVSKSFIQCHRSYIVNSNHVKSWSTRQLLIADYKIPISRSRKSKILEALRAR